MKVLAPFLVSLSAFATTELPVCINLGTRSEGWDFGGKLKYSNCAKKSVECANGGSTPEGWMAFEKRNHVFLTRADCADE